MTFYIMGISINKKTYERLHRYCQRGEKHDNLVNRLIDLCEKDKEMINISEKTTERLLFFTGCKDIDEALNMVLDKCRNIMEAKR